MPPVHPIDTPKRTVLAAHATTLRAKLKDWEKSFTASHSGCKPDKEDIRACLEIAKTYKEYNRVRDVLDGKPDVQSVDAAARRSTTISKARKRKGDVRGHGSEPEARRDSVNASTLRIAKVSSTQGRSPPHPNMLDPYDPPTSASPRPYIVTAIGPTPQRDGKILGLFDLVSNSGNSSQATPSIGKRKADALGDVVEPDAGIPDEQMIALTPSRKRIRSANGRGDILDHLDGGSPMENQRHSKTPTSEGKKYMLSQFFATPSTLRFATIAEDQDVLHCGHPMDRGASPRRTPLRAHVLGERANRDSEAELLTLDATPAYLKRSYSFKDRLLSVSATTTASAESRKTNLSSPTSIRAGPPTLRRYKSGPKPLSEIVRGLRQMDDERHDDDLDALREMESGRTDILVGERQASNVAAAAPEGGKVQEVTVADENRVPQKAWRKKGQKRTTRRTNMKPVKMKPKNENQWVAEDSESEDWEELDAVDKSQYATQQTKQKLVDAENNNLADRLSTSRGREFEAKDMPIGRDNEKADVSDAEFEPDGNRDEVENHEKPSEPKATGKTMRNLEVRTEATKPVWEKTKHEEKDVPDKAKRRGPTINPNAVSHQNFRSLKIRNKNAKGKGGRGRFGRKGR